MKIIALGDTHGRDLWKEIIEKEKPDKVIFIGDYFDSFDIDVATQINNFLDICAYKRANPETILLIGNHDYHYFPEVGDHGVSGYNEEASYTIGHALSGNRDLLQMAHQIKVEGIDLPILFSHAGVSVQWLSMNYTEWKDEHTAIDKIVNELWKDKPNSFMFNGRDSYGNDPYQTPIWIRPSALMRANGTFKKNIIQVVGHTRQNEIDIEGKATGGFYYFIDTIGTRQYLIIEDEFKLGKI